MVQLSKRLKMVASMVSPGNTVGDIGCDHAHTSIYLIEQGISEKIIAMDVNEGPIQRAQENIFCFGCQNTIETRLSDGAKELKPGEVDTLLISGMGGGLVMKILMESPEVVDSIKELILQPQSEIAEVRHFLHQQGFRIMEEQMLTEDGKHYTAIRAIRGSESYEHEVFYRYGKCLLEGKNPSLHEFLQYGSNSFGAIIQELEQQDYDRNKERLTELKKDFDLMKEALSYFDEGGNDLENNRNNSMETIIITVNGQEREYPYETTFLEISRDFQKDYDADIILVKANGDLRELNAKAKKNAEVSFLTTKEVDGLKTYTRGITMVLMKAIYRVVDKDAITKVSIEHSMGPGYYGEIEMSGELTEELLIKMEDEMRTIVERDLVFIKKSMKTKEAIEKFHEYKMYAKEKLFRYRRVSRTNVYSLGSFEDYFFGYMPPSTGMLKYFKLLPYEKGFILQLPTKDAPTVVPELSPRHKLFQIMREANHWGRNMGIDTVGDLNGVIASGGVDDLILIQEAFHEKKIGEIAEQISALKNRKFVMIAGPSSSGKTTFSHRLSIQLRTFGLKPHPIGVDDYFVEREKTPLNPDGTYNFECLEAIDVEQFNHDMKALLDGERVELPSFNFKTGKREYKGNYKQLGPDDILVIEGIHGLNDKLSYALPAESKFKIYISALTTLNIDEHNQISTSDGRLIRRMVRDARTRGASASKTIQMWKSVRQGEENYIFPFQESADVMFNSAMIYEISVLKQFAEPILFHIEPGDPAYSEAKRMLKFLDYFIGVNSEEVPHNSILREFVGKSYFNV